MLVLLTAQSVPCRVFRDVLMVGTPCYIAMIVCAHINRLDPVLGLLNSPFVKEHPNPSALSDFVKFLLENHFHSKVPNF